MNYRHAYHAGNFADVLKHLVLRAIIQALQAKSSAFGYLETHAGSGTYRLDGIEAGKTGEYRHGIGRLWQGTPASPWPKLLGEWLAALREDPDNGETLRVYPGSPLQAVRLLRSIDSARLCEWQTEECTQLRQLFRDDPRVHVHQRDGYEALTALLPPPERRGLVLIDPSYEAQEQEYPRLEQALNAALQRWPSGIYAVWYPIKQRASLQGFMRYLRQANTSRVLRVELSVRPEQSPLRLNGSGMAVLNAPWQLDASLHSTLSVLQQQLGQNGSPASVRLDWLQQN